MGMSWRRKGEATTVSQALPTKLLQPDNIASASLPHALFYVCKCNFEFLYS